MAQQEGRDITTGEFAKMLGVNKQTLLHYDDIGLLSPEYKSANGYRKYSYNQFELFYIIRLFKDLNIPLKTIKTILYDQKPAEILNVLQQQQATIDQQIAYLTHLKKVIDVKMILIDEALHTNIYELREEVLPEEQFAISEDVHNYSEQKYIHVLSKFIYAIEEQQMNMGYPLGAMLLKEAAVRNDFYHYQYFYMKADGQSDALSLYKRPAGTYLIGYQVGEQIEELYTKMFAYAQEHNYTIGKYMYEEYLFDGIFLDDEDKRITKVYMLVS